MPIGIRATVDFAFKKIFGSPQNSQALMGLLNAILGLDSPIEAVEILNPFSYQDFADDKLIVLDVRCRDEAGRYFNVEMQVSAQRDLLKRLTYYASSMYTAQLQLGDDYSLATTAISICLLEQNYFRDSDQAHHRYQLVDLASGRELADAIEVHTVELSKYDLSESTIATATQLHQWVFLLLRAHQYDAPRLKQLLPGNGFDQAIDTMALIAAKTEDRQMYDQRERARRDYASSMINARKEAREEGHEEGRQEGREEGREEGRVEGRVEGKLVGSIQEFQELLADAVSSDAELLSKTTDELRTLLAELKARLRR